MMMTLRVVTKRVRTENNDNTDDDGDADNDDDDGDDDDYSQNPIITNTSAREATHLCS